MSAGSVTAGTDEVGFEGPVKDLERFVQLQRTLLARPDGPERLRGASPDAHPDEPHRRLGVVLRRLLLLGSELRAELPDPAGFLEIAAAAATEVALLVTTGGSLAKPAAHDALDHLAALQRDRLLLHHPTATGWQQLPPDVHLQRAFWQLAGLGLEVMVGSFQDGQSEEHGADCANYLLFATVTAGAWQLAADETRLDPPAFPAPEFPGAGIPKGDRR